MHDAVPTQPRSRHSRSQQHRATALHLAAAGGHAVAVAWLLTTLGPKVVAAAAADGSTASHLAVAHGQRRYLGVSKLEGTTGALEHGATQAVQVGGLGWKDQGLGWGFGA